MNQRNGWHSTAVKDIAAKSRHSFIDGDWIEAPFITTSGIRLIQTGNIGVGTFIDKNTKFISEASFKALRCKPVHEGDILICRLADPIGRSCIVPSLDTLAITSVDVAILRVDESNYHRDFIAHALNQPTFLSACLEHSAGSTRQRISRTNLGVIPILVPEDKVEQSKIAEVLSTVDRAIEQTEAVIAKQQRIKSGVMQDLLTRGIDEHGNLRSEQTHQFKDSPLGRTPVEWEVTTVGGQFTLRRERGRPGLPVMSIMMNHGLVERSKVDRRVESALPDEGHALVLEGDIAYNMMRMWQGVLGRASFECLVSPAYVVLKPRISIDSRFAEWLFRDLRMIHAFRRASRGVVDDRLRLYPYDMFLIPFAMPTSPDEQSLIVERLESQKALIATAVRDLEKLRHIRAGLVQDLLTGNRRVTALLAPGVVTA
jgi:Restriction endonuclease S subunits